MKRTAAALMDVDVEVAQINARVQALIGRRAREAMARMDARWPASDAVVVEPPRNSVEAWGQILRFPSRCLRQHRRGLRTRLDRDRPGQTMIHFGSPAQHTDHTDGSAS